MPDMFFRQSLWGKSKPFPKQMNVLTKKSQEKRQTQVPFRLNGFFKGRQRSEKQHPVAEGVYFVGEEEEVTSVDEGWSGGWLGGIQVLKSGGADMDFGDLPEGYEPRSDEELDDELPF